MKKVKKVPWSLRKKGNGYKGLREFFMAQHPYCYWCGRLVRYYLPEPHKTLSDDFATIDHLKSRFFRKKNEVVEKVLACNKCNNERAQAEEVLYGRKPKSNRKISNKGFHYVQFN